MIYNVDDKLAELFKDAATGEFLYATMYRAFLEGYAYGGSEDGKKRGPLVSFQVSNVGQHSFSMLHRAAKDEVGKEAGDE